MYEAVAHLLAFVFGLRAKGRAAGSHELPRPRRCLGNRLEYAVNSGAARADQRAENVPRTARN